MANTARVKRGAKPHTSPLIGAPPLGVCSRAPDFLSCETGSAFLQLSLGDVCLIALARGRLLGVGLNYPSVYRCNV